MRTTTSELRTDGGYSPTDVHRLLEAAADEGLMKAYWPPPELHPTNLPVALVHAVHDVPPTVEDPALVAERYAQSVGIDPVHDDRWDLPPCSTQYSLEDLEILFESPGLPQMQSVLRSRSVFPGTDLSRMAYVVAAAKALRGAEIAILQDVHAVGESTIASVIATVPGDGRGVVRRLLAYTAADDWVLADEPVQAFVAAAIAAPKVSRRVARTLLRDAAYEVLVAPRDLDLRVWLACTQGPTDGEMPHASSDDAIRGHHNLRVHE